MRAARAASPVVVIATTSHPSATNSRAGDSAAIGSSSAITTRSGSTLAGTVISGPR